MEIEKDSIFVKLTVIDDMVFQDCILSGKTILLLDSRESVFKIKSDIKFRPVAFFQNYITNANHLKILQNGGVDELVLLPCNNWEQLGIELINIGFKVKMLNTTMTELLMYNNESLAKNIAKNSKSYYDFTYEKFISKHSESLMSDTKPFNSYLTSTFQQLKMTKIDHVSFNSWLIEMINKQDDYYCPLAFDIIKSSLIESYTKK